MATCPLLLPFPPSLLHPAQNCTSHQNKRLRCAAFVILAGLDPMSETLGKAWLSLLQLRGSNSNPPCPISAWAKCCSPAPSFKPGGNSRGCEAVP